MQLATKALSPRGYGLGDKEREIEHGGIVIQIQVVVSDATTPKTVTRDEKQD